MNLATLLDRRVERIVLPDDASEHERVLVEFIEFMREGDLETAMMLVDPSSPGYEDLERGLAAIAVGIERYDAETGIPVDDFLRMMFTIAYDSCRYELVYSDEAGQAVQYRLTFDDAQPVLFQTEEGEIIRYIPGRPAAAEITVTIHSVDGEWMIYPEPHPDGLIRPVGLMREGATPQ
ncbi:MAG: hypothetical protein EA380_10570 [Phycisphaeraceae bacterium]|nr:MAG: hypothetical protein EA380_10570 [Phycisphaeraceae bacterium]